MKTKTDEKNNTFVLKKIILFFKYFQQIPFYPYYIFYVNQDYDNFSLEKYSCKKYMGIPQKSLF